MNCKFATFAKLLPHLRKLHTFAARFYIETQWKVKLFIPVVRSPASGSNPKFLNTFSFLLFLAG
jgi:hypothetical protein